jgi:hypothetical protein
MIGILNNKQWIYEDGTRTVTLDGKSSEVPAHSGTLLEGKVTDVSLDGVMHIHSAEPLRVRYQASKGPERGRATDRLFLNYRDGKRAFKAGETISRYTATIQIR